MPSGIGSSVKGRTDRAFPRPANRTVHGATFDRGTGQPLVEPNRSCSRSRFTPPTSQTGVLQITTRALRALHSTSLRGPKSCTTVANGWFRNCGDKTVSRIAETTNRVVATIPVPPARMALNLLPRVYGRDRWEKGQCRASTPQPTGWWLRIRFCQTRRDASLAKAGR
jgi:hypothetical protein